MEVASLSIFPCERCRRPVKGALSAAYVNLTNGSTRSGRKIRLCSKHLEELLEGLKGWWTEILDDYGQEPLSGCTRCAEPVDSQTTRYGLFGNIYPKGQDPRFFYGVLCSRDAHALKDTYQLQED